MTLTTKKSASSIKLLGLEKSFHSLRGKVDVLKGITLTINAGEFFVLLGPSGCGKSTLLNLIAGLEKPSAGSVEIDGKAVADSAHGIFLDPFQRDISMVFQSYALYPHMTVEKNLAFPLTNLPTKPSKEEIRHMVAEAAKLLQIENLLDRKPSELSGGQRQRVAIGRALVRKPAVFLMDEPLSNLDAQLRMDMRAQLKELQQRLGITTVYVTHDQMEAMTLGDRIAIVNEGILQQTDSPVDVYNRPNSVFVARFIGSPPMNIYRGSLAESETGTVLRTEDHTIFLPKAIQSQLETKGSKDCIIGIRPEHIQLVEQGQGNMDATVSVVENIGSEYLVYFFSVSGQTVVRTSQKPPSGKIGLVFPAEKIHILSNEPPTS